MNITEDTTLFQTVITGYIDRFNEEYTTLSRTMYKNRLDRLSLFRSLISSYGRIVCVYWNY
jgi:hypothetical protein